MLVPYLPNTATSGGQTRWYNIIKYLSKKHDITLFSLVKDVSEEKFIPELKKYCKKVMVFERPKKPWTLRNVLLSVFGPFPLLVIRNLSLEERRAVSEELANEKYDLIHAETFYVMPHLVRTDVPTILVEQTIWHDVYKHHVETKVPLLLRPFYMYDVFKVKYWERHYWAKANKLVAVSEEDRGQMLKLIPGVKVDIIPNGVDTEFYSAKKIERKSPPRILYGVTNFEWLQNLEASEILLNNVWPKVKSQVPEAKVWIVGRKIAEWIKKLSEVDKSVEVTENIPDARDAYGSASIMVAPIKGAGGTRLKILEAMAAGLPVVSTSIGVAGLDITHGKQALIADTDQGLANEAAKLLKNPEVAERIGKAGREHVRTYFDWKVIVKLHDPIYRQVLKTK
ncbi:MAG: glycosyltransferase family 4 protein [Patescibacteria group bacterium]